MNIFKTTTSEQQILKFYPYFINLKKEAREK